MDHLTYKNILVMFNKKGWEDLYRTRNSRVNHMTLNLSFRSLAVGSSHRLNEGKVWVKFYESFFKGS